MAIKVGISGFGRIGRVVIRAAMDMPEIEIAAINVRNADLEYLVYQLKYDSTFGRFPRSLDLYENGIVIDGKKVPVYSESEAVNIPWSEAGVEYVNEEPEMPEENFNYTEPVNGETLTGDILSDLNAIAEQTD